MKMSNNVKDIDIKNRTCYFLNVFTSVNNFDPNNIKIDKKSYKNIFIYHIGYVAIKDSKYAKIYGVNSLYLIFNKVNGYFEEINGNNYLTLVPTDGSKGKKIRNEELWIKIRDSIRSVIKNSDDFDENYIKI